MDWAAAVTAVCTLLALILQGIAKAKETSEAKQDETNIQQARKTLANTDGRSFDAVAADQHDRVQRALRGGNR